MTAFLDIIPKFSTPALCAESPDPDQWHPPSGGEGARIAERAKAVCRRCPSLAECGAYAIANPSLSGVWAGMSAKERLEARRVIEPPPRRLPSRCSKGHAYTESNTRMTDHGRRCRACHNANNRAAREAS